HALAAKEYAAVVADQTRLLGPEHDLTLSSHSGLGYALFSLNKFAGAEPEFRAVVAGREHTAGPENWQTVGAHSMLAWSLDKQNKHAEAAAEYQKVLASRMRSPGPGDPSTLRTMEDLARILSDLDRFKESADVRQLIVMAIPMQPIDEAAKKSTLIGAHLALSWTKLFAKDFAGASESAEQGIKIGGSTEMLDTN